MFDKLLAGCDVLLNTDFRDWCASVGRIPAGADVLYTGAIDEYFGYCFGPLEYRSLRFEHERHDETDNLQGVAVVNYTDKSVPYTRTIEHKHFEFGKQPFTVVSKEYPSEWHQGIEPYYPINDEKNQRRYLKYVELAKSQAHVMFGGRLGLYCYTDMQDTIIAALERAREALDDR